MDDEVFVGDAQDFEVGEDVLVDEAEERVFEDGARDAKELERVFEVAAVEDDLLQDVGFLGELKHEVFFDYELLKVIAEEKKDILFDLTVIYICTLNICEEHLHMNFDVYSYIFYPKILAVGYLVRSREPH